MDHWSTLRSSVIAYESLFSYDSLFLTDRLSFGIHSQSLDLLLDRPYLHGASIFQSDFGKTMTFIIEMELIYDIYLAHYNLSLSKLEMNAIHFSQTMTVSQIFAFYHLQNMVKTHISETFWQSDRHKKPLVTFSTSYIKNFLAMSLNLVIIDDSALWTRTPTQFHR